MSLACVTGGLMTGCSANFTPSSTVSDTSPLGEIDGVVHGGQQPIVGAKVYVYAAATSGYAGASKSLITGTGYVTTGNGGAFHLTGNYTCTQGQQVYVVVQGGDSSTGVLPAANNNTAISLMAPLGTCPASGTLAGQIGYVVVNEVSTVAVAYALAGFGADASHIGSSNTALAQTDIGNAFATALNIETQAYGQVGATTVNGAGTLPQAKLYTLADALASCVNTPSSTSSQCTALFKATSSNGIAAGAAGGGTAAADTAQAAFNIAHNQATVAPSLYAYASATSPFQPVLSSAPADWTLPIVYRGVSTLARNIAFDTAGNAWMGDLLNPAVIKVSPFGVVSRYTGGVNGGMGAIGGVAVSPAGIIAATDFANNAGYVLDTDGDVLGTYTTGFNQPIAVVFDAAGNAQVANSGSYTISRYNSSGTALTPVKTSTTTGGAYWLALDSNNNIWTPAYSASCSCVGYVTSGSTTGTTYGETLFNTNILNQSTGLAIDSNDAKWQVNFNGSLARFVISSYIGVGVVNYVNDQVEVAAGTGGMSQPTGVAIDGSGRPWIANSGSPVVSGFTSAGVPLATNGFATGSTQGNTAIAPDGSGNLWASSQDSTLTEFVGLSTPTAQPLLPGQLGVRP